MPPCCCSTASTVPQHIWVSVIKAKENVMARLIIDVGKLVPLSKVAREIKAPSHKEADIAYECDCFSLGINGKLTSVV